jgi:hypothetical protein
LADEKNTAFFRPPPKNPPLKGFLTCHSSSLATDASSWRALASFSVAFWADDLSLDRQLFALAVVKIFQLNSELVADI